MASSDRQILRLRLDYSSAKNRYAGNNHSSGAVVQRLRLAHTHSHRRRTAVQIRVQGVLRCTRHTARAIFPLQPRKQRISRSSGEKSQGDCFTLLRKGGEYPPGHRCLEKHSQTGRIITSSTLLRTKTKAWPASTTSASGGSTLQRPGRKKQRSHTHAR